MSENTIGLGVAGIGGWGKNVLRAFGSVEGARVAGICDPDSVRLSAAADHFPDAQTHAEFSCLLEQPGIEAVVLATPADLHYSMAHASLEAGKHVFVEKPITLQAREARELVDMAERAQRKLMAGHLLLYHPAIERMKELIDAGDIGDVLSISTRRLNLGVVRNTENAFWSLAPHDVSVALYLLGQEPTRIDANGACFLQPGIEDSVVANLGFPGGQMVNIHVSWLDPRKVREIVVVGTRQMLVFDETADHKLMIHHKSAVVRGNQTVLHKGDAAPADVPSTPPLNLEAQHFVDAIRYNRTPRSDGRDGLRVVRILEEVERILRRAREAGAA